MQLIRTNPSFPSGYNERRRRCRTVVPQGDHAEFFLPSLSATWWLLPLRSDSMTDLSAPGRGTNKREKKGNETPFGLHQSRGGTGPIPSPEFRDREVWLYP